MGRDGIRSNMICKYATFQDAVKDIKIMEEKGYSSDTYYLDDTGLTITYMKGVSLLEVKLELLLKIRARIDYEMECIQDRMNALRKAISPESSNAVYSSMEYEKLKYGESVLAQLKRYVVLTGDDIIKEEKQKKVEQGENTNHGE